MTKTSDIDSLQNNAEEAGTPKAVPVSGVEQDDALRIGSAGSAEEVGGPQGPEPTRYGDWEKKGRCIDF